MSNFKTVARRLIGRDPVKMAILALFILSCVGMAYYCHFILGIEVVFTHFFYVPIVLAAFWWGRRAVWVAIFLGGWLIASDALSPSAHVLEISNLLRSGMFVAVGLTVGILRERVLRLGTVEELAATLQKEKAYSESIISNMSDLLIVFDRKGRIETVNEQTERRLNYSRDELLGKLVGRFFEEEEEEEEEEFSIRRLNQLLREGSTKGVGVQIRTKQGAVLPVLVSIGAIMNGAGEAIRYVATAKDITDLRRAEEERRRLEMQLVHAGRLPSLGEMAAAIAHELNQPLSVISMAVEGRLRDIEKKRLEISALPSDLEDIMRNVKRIDRIITHVRTFARKPEEIRTVNPEEVLDNVFTMLGEQFKVHDISVSRNIGEKLPLIETDANQLEQVFVNILTNARQVLDKRVDEAAKKGESFEKRLVCGISRERIEENEWVVYRFADNAYGVPDELKTRVFEPFFTTREFGEGTGLGLSISYSIVTRSLGGRIWVEDNEMGGASFKVAVPVKT